MPRLLVAACLRHQRQNALGRWTELPAMKTYAALACTGPVHLGSLDSVSYPYVLVSFAYDKKGDWLERLSYRPAAMLDSGAFTVRSQGHEVDLDAYIEWCKAYADIFPDLRVTNLDVIPGGPGRLPTTRERTQAAKQSAKNAGIIREAGLRVIEVHHLFDKPENLDRIIETRQPGEVIGVAGLGGAGASARVGKAFGDSVFARLRDLCGWAHLPPIHGFGVATPQLLYRYPLASIDASTWTAPHRFGQRYERGRPLRGLQRRTDESDHLRNRTVVTYAQSRILADWQDREEAITQYWADRGVVIEPEGAARV